MVKSDSLPLKYYTFEYSICGIKDSIDSPSVSLAIDRAKTRWVTKYFVPPSDPKFRAKKAGVVLDWIRLELSGSQLQRFKELYRWAKESSLMDPSESKEFEQLTLILRDKRLSK